MRSRLERVPAWAWLGGLVVLSVALRAWLVRGMVAPFVFVDELIYAELARSLAETGSYAVREMPVSGYSLLYPAVLAPAYAAFDSLTDAYAAAKAVNAIVMSLAAVPAYLLARRVTGRWPSLLAAALAVALPSMAYTATLVTENLFYPVALVAALALVRYLERPSRLRLLGLLAALAVALATRSQALALVAGAATAPLALAALRRDARLLRSFAPLWAVLGGIVAAVVLVQLARGRPLSSLLGAYSVVGEGGYDAGHVLRYWLWHVEELVLYAGVVPAVVLGVLLAVGRTVPARVQEHLAATVALAAWSTLVVAAFASRFASDRIQDRYLFFLVPLLLVALLAWVGLGAPRPLVAFGASALVALGLVTAFPYVRFVGEPAKSDTLGLIPLWTANAHLVGGSFRLTVLLAGAALVAFAWLVPRRYAIAVPLVALALFVALSRPVWSGPQGVLRAGEGALFQGIRGVPRDWIDAAVPSGSDVAVLWTGRADRFTVNQNEFFNARVGDVYYTSYPTPGSFGETRVAIDPDDGTVRAADGSTVDEPYALLDGSITPDGELVARDDPLGIGLWRLHGPLVSTTTVEGLYPNDTWSGSWATWERLRCTGGELRVALHSDPTLFAGRLTHVLATVEDMPAARIAVPPEGSVELRVPLQAVDGRCLVRFDVSPTLVPAEQSPESTDDRRLGVHFDAFVHEQPA